MANAIAIADQLKDILKRELELGEQIDQLQLEDSLSTIGLNSMSFIKLIVAIEKKFDFEFEDEDLNYQVFKTLQDVVNYIEKRIE
ncbi:acyl carrier protein [Paenibacillus monticola]|uniref:Phosphopantetheine attachment site family protein n=1 Tax=Paenibacillus monticola TaxID=2666075 RepID=A0A7X2HBH6_9BACL|nr:phosphopantetheine-binding protein [Paenibacillus monticola]MRN57064.1 phosphopantetheine attachment site family protein [Paenibacillus monticola]